MENTFETKYGEVKLRGVMIDVDGHSLEDGTDISIDGKFIKGVLGSVNFDEDSDIEEVEKFLEEVIDPRDL